MRDFAMFYDQETALKNKRLLESMDFRVEISAEPYEGKTGYFVRYEERVPGAEKRLMHKTKK